LQPNFATQKCHLQLKVVANDIFEVQNLVANNSFSSTIIESKNNIFKKITL